MEVRTYSLQFDNSDLLQLQFKLPKGTYDKKGCIGAFLQSNSCKVKSFVGKSAIDGGSGGKKDAIDVVTYETPNKNKRVVFWCRKLKAWAVEMERNIGRVYRYTLGSIHITVLFEIASGQKSEKERVLLLRVGGTRCAVTNFEKHSKPVPIQDVICFKSPNGVAHKLFWSRELKVWALSVDKTISAPSPFKMPLPATRSSKKICALPGCTKPINSNNTHYIYCGKTHARVADSEEKQPAVSGPAVSGPAEIKTVPITDPKVLNLIKRFAKSWNKKSVADPHTITVVKIENKKLEKIFQKYRKEVALEMKDGNVLKYSLFHGTTTKCEFGWRRDDISICSLATCATCNIIKVGFQVERCKDNTGWARFGNGLYFAENASKSHDYTKNAKKDCRRIILVVDVVLGNVKRYKQNQPTLKAPPAGHHSVHGVPGVDLNYAEYVVYCNEAVIPRYAIIYQF